MDARCVLREVKPEILHVIQMKLCFKINTNFHFLINYKDDEEMAYIFFLWRYGPACAMNSRSHTTTHHSR